MMPLLKMIRGNRALDVSKLWWGSRFENGALHGQQMLECKSSMGFINMIATNQRNLCKINSAVGGRGGVKFRS